MKYASLVLALFLPSTVMGAEYLEEAETEVYQTTGTVKEITQKAKTCIAQTISAGGADLFLDVNIDSGTITANCSTSYTSMLVGHTVKSKMTFLAKENRFRMRHMNIEEAIENGEFTRVGKWAGSGWKTIQKSLFDVSGKIAKCVQADSKKEEW